MIDNLEPVLAELHAARVAYDEARRVAWSPPDNISNRLLEARTDVLAVAGGERVTVLGELPPCDAGAPMPLLLGDGQSIWLSYFGAVEPYFTDRVVVRFTRVDSVVFGGANDEALHGHRLWGQGLQPYSFHEVICSRWTQARERENSVHDHHRPAAFARLRHFVFTFHDETFECLADDFALDSSGMGAPLRELNDAEARAERC